jgi:hypothetical protein
VWQDSISMMGDLVRIRWHDLRGRYGGPTRMTGPARARSAEELPRDNLAVADEMERSRRPGKASQGSAGVTPESSVYDH